jgi:hypothetical protein
VKDEQEHDDSLPSQRLFVSLLLSLSLALTSPSPLVSAEECTIEADGLVLASNNPNAASTWFCGSTRKTPTWAFTRHGVAKRRRQLPEIAVLQFREWGEHKEGFHSM